jgi:hypothetical protein
VADDDQPTAPTPPEPAPEPTVGDAPAPEAAVPTSESVAAPPPPPPTGAVAAPPRRSRRWLVVFLVIMGLIVLIVVAGGVLFATRTLPPYNAASDFVDDLADNKFQAAADQLCATDQDDPDAAISTVTRHFAGRDNVVVNPLTVDRDGDIAWVDYTVSSDDSTGDDDDEETHQLVVIEEDGDWKPCPSGAAR